MEERVCDVCRLVPPIDNRVKLCTYCPVCDAWICEECQNDWGRRARASAMRLQERWA